MQQHRHFRTLRLHVSHLACAVALLLTLACSERAPASNRSPSDQAPKPLSTGKPDKQSPDKALSLQQTGQESTGSSIASVRNELGLPAHAALSDLPADGGDAFNRLVFASSPYLLQHAANPIDWWPWGGAAFQHARDHELPLLLSIGYSSCHWCHVMELESFRDDAIAAFINQHFVAVKLDREERPDVDEQYQAAIRVLSGEGGWPATLVLMPDGRVVDAGTYFPTEPRADRESFRQFLDASLERIQARETGSRGARLGALEAGDGVPSGLHHAAYDALIRTEDARFGGFGARQGTRFPRGHVMRFLIDYAASADGAASDAQAMALAALRSMASRGLHDHLAGGFHRYTLDRAWSQPHFEKMLYDQATLALAYAEAAELADDDDEALAMIARSTLDFVLRDLRVEEGGFASAMNATLDADVAELFTWTPVEVAAALDDPTASELFCRYFGVTDQGNFIDEVSGEATGRSVLQALASIDDVAGELGMKPEDAREMLASSRSTLLKVRGARDGLLIDAKVLVDQNGMLLSALARAGSLLDEANYLQAARNLANTLLDAIERDGALPHTLHQRDQIPGMLPDYAALARRRCLQADATGSERYSAAALELTRSMVERFGDQERGGFWMRDRTQDAESIVANYMPHMDGAYPSGTGMAMQALTAAISAGAADLRPFAEQSFATLALAMRGLESEHACTLLALADWRKAE